MKDFKSIDFRKLHENATQLIGYDWMLITAGNIRDFNTMTAAWGGFGYLWNLQVVHIFIRPQRYTYQFTEQEKYFTLQFFEPSFRKVLNYCGKHSGRDVDKIAETGLRPFETQKGNVYFEQARLQMECRKIYSDLIEPENFFDDSLLKHYPENDFNRFYIGEISDCYIKRRAV
mgnify:CR=1 FL=1